MKTALLALLLICSFDLLAQQGKNSASLGLFYSNPLKETKNRNILKPGFGAEFTYEPRLSNHSGILIQFGVGSYKSNEDWLYHEDDNIKVFSLKVAYRYYFTPAGFYLNAGPGLDYYTDHEPMGGSLNIGGGKRFLLTDKYFIDAGVDYIDGSTERRMNVKVAIGKFPNRNKTIIKR